MYEIFLDIPGYEGLYQVSNQGNVKSLYTNRILTPLKDKDGYYRVCLYKDGKKKSIFIHRLVLSTFKANPDNKPQINHINEDKSDNSLNNLEWATREENINHGTRTQRAKETCFKNGHFEKKYKQVLCVETGTVYKSIMEASTDLKIDNSHITKCCKGKQKTAGGYHWSYYNPSTLPE